MRELRLVPGAATAWLAVIAVLLAGRGWAIAIIVAAVALCLPFVTEAVASALAQVGPDGAAVPGAVPVGSDVGSLVGSEVGSLVGFEVGSAQLVYGPVGCGHCPACSRGSATTAGGGGASRRSDG